MICFVPRFLFCQRNAFAAPRNTLHQQVSRTSYYETSCKHQRISEVRFPSSGEDQGLTSENRFCTTDQQHFPDWVFARRITSCRSTQLYIFLERKKLVPRGPPSIRFCYFLRRLLERSFSFAYKPEDFLNLIFVNQGTVKWKIITLYIRTV